MKILLLIPLALLSCNDSNWPRCSQEMHPDPIIQNGMSVKNLGSITIDGEVCKVEEVVQYQPDAYCPKELSCNPFTGDQYGVCATDDNLKCHYCGIESIAKPFVRRIICPSGKNGTSSVGEDGTKFHREVLQ